MTSKHNLGPVIALTGAGIAVAAVIAGFILVGGPGDARERRLDDMTMQRISSVTQTAQCVFNVTGAAPVSIEEMHTVAMRAAASGKTDACGYGAPQLASDSKVQTGGPPQAAGDVSFEKLDNSRIRICGNFRRPFDPTNTPSIWGDGPYAELQQARPAAGEHCYEITLVKFDNPVSAPELPASLPPPL